MNSFNQGDKYGVYRSGTSSSAISSFMSGVYMWMVAGLALSGITAFTVATTPEAITAILTNKLLFWGIVALQFGAVIWLSARIQAMSVMFAGSLFLGYSILTGLTLSVIFVAFTMQSIASAFFITSAGFLGLSLIGFITKRDLGPVGTFCMMGLFGLIALMILGFFFPSLVGGSMRMVINVCGLIIFSGLTAYDTQRLKNYGASMSGDVARKGAIHGALMLYLDFINLFLFILQTAIQVIVLNSYKDYNHHKYKLK